MESKTLRNSLMPIALTTLDSIKGLLLDMARDSCRIVLQDIQERIAMLQVRPAVLDDFVAYQVGYRVMKSTNINLAQQSFACDVQVCFFNGCVFGSIYEEYHIIIFSYNLSPLSQNTWDW